MWYLILIVVIMFFNAVNAVASPEPVHRFLNILLVVGGTVSFIILWNM